MPPSLHHGIPREMLRRRPGLGLDLLARGLGTYGDGYGDARVEPIDMARRVTGARADPIISVTGPDGERRCLIIELRHRHDMAELWAWIGHAGELMARMRCGVILVLVCPDETAAAEYRKAIPATDSCMRFVPVVLGPRQLPRIQDPEEIRRSPELATLSAAAHADDLDTLGAVAKALVAADDDYGLLYYDFLRAQLGEEIRTRLEDMMIDLNQRLPDRFTKPLEDAAEERGKALGMKLGQALGEARGKKLGGVEGKRELLVSMLRVRGLELGEDHRKAIEACVDDRRFTAWGVRAGTAETADEIFGETI